MVCPYCGSSDIKKNGILPSGKQRYYCKSCKRYHSENTPIRKTVKDRCPYCNGELKPAGHNNSGSPRFICKTCGRKSSGENSKIRFSYINKDIKCVFCNGTNIKKGGHLTDGTQRYWCKDCNKFFSSKTIVREPITFTCPNCNSSHINRSGHGRTGKQVYICRDCGVKFISEKTYRKPQPYKVTCPICGHEYSKKCGHTGDGSQYYKCLSCNHKFLINGKYKQLTETQKQNIIKLYDEGKTQQEIAKEFSCTTRTVYRTLRSEKITDEQKKLIIMYGTNFGVSVEDLSQYLHCSKRKCEEILTTFRSKNG